MGSDLGASREQLLALSSSGPVDAALFDGRASVALEYAEAMTVGDVDDGLYARVETHFGADEIVELTGAIAWENSSARFNRALRIPSQKLWSS
ncbi:MAG: hypothetical protein P1V35_07600 [Planctomycetota bacterium]|nr:hypothetical protein [Planctomycetota bacterium]